MDFKRIMTLVGLLCAVMLTAFLLVANDEGAEEWTEESEICFDKSKPDSYYCCGPDTVLLFEHPVKVVSFHRKGKAEVIRGVEGLVFSRIIDRDLIDVVVYEYTERNRAVRKSVMDKYHLFPYYYDPSGLELIPTESIDLKLKKEEDLRIVKEIAGDYGCEVLDYPSDIWCYLLVTPESHLNPVDVANRLAATGLFLVAEPWFACEGADFSYDPYVTRQWPLYNTYNYTGVDMSVSKAWNYATGRGVKVAVIDGGVMLNHSDLVANISKLSYDAESGKSGSIIRDSGHGTYCAGIIAAVRNNDKGIVGISPDASLMSISLKISDKSYVLKFKDAIEWAWKNGADVINCSWSCPYNLHVKEALDNALKYGRGGKGCVIVTSAGNTRNEITFPGNYDDRILTVSGIRGNGDIIKDSAHGKNVLVAAPGSQVWTTALGDSVDVFDGTSAAAPHVAAVAALILERNPNLTNVQVRDIIAKSTKKIGKYEYKDTLGKKSWNEYYGYGLVDAYEALRNTKRPGEK